jgi:hypothetical protein
MNRGFPVQFPLCIVAAFGLVVGIRPTVASAEEAAASPGSTASNRLEPERVDAVVGELVCLDCDPDRVHLAEAMAHCREAGHRHGLRAGYRVYELRPGNATARDALYSPELFGKEVSAVGKFTRSLAPAVSGGVGTVVAGSIEKRF